MAPLIVLLVSWPVTEPPMTSDQVAFHEREHDAFAWPWSSRPPRFTLVTSAADPKRRKLLKFSFRVFQRLQ